MGLYPRQHDHARHRHVPRRRAYRGKAAARLCAGTTRGLIAALCLMGGIAQADTLRIATYHTDLSRDGPGLLLRDLQRGDDPQIIGFVHIMAKASPDIVLLTDLDHDAGHLTLDALRAALTDVGLDYSHAYAPPQNAGLDSSADLDGDRRLGEAEDSHGFGRFTGDGAMALLSRYPLNLEHAQDFSSFLWADLPDALITGAVLPPELRDVQRLSSAAHWVVPVETPGGPITILAFHATPPVFDGPEDRNGRRNHDEIRFWQHYLDGAIGPVLPGPYALMGTANLDPVDGEGRHEAIMELLSDPRLQDPEPRRDHADPPQGPGQSGDPALDTANWDEPAPGDLRVDYVLPSADLTVRDNGIIWPEPESVAAQASRHGLVWVDLVWPTDR
ncbi:endonuclease/exonuclease/phosphatase family protein [Primorskyibacter aestuariivivens]|uniref:endonuclease/exonuclease/phosphatase family protein n=1 Tax=Primorskyibacter aestuariivivens TaxID=1888912 RepID=UPI00230011F5|nr:endonuclease/exonuclease/phosphatase family protein [Primorskyibacter aestuariivivens]MDA7428277.1 endonuclease/exonuclease/phosphatase family protein [Primorskyibacter aestuariivivens]